MYSLANKIDPEKLQVSDLFKHLDFDARRKIVQSSRMVSLLPEKELFEQSRKSRYFYLLIEGQVKLSLTSLNGNERVIDFVQPGDAIAHPLMFLRRPVHAVSAVATCESVLYRFSNRVFLEILKSSPKLCLQFLVDLSSRLEESIGEIDRLTLQSSRDRVVHYLQQLHHNSGSSVFQLNASRKLIASRLSISPETFSRIMRDLEDDNVVSQSGSTVIILNQARLRLHSDYPGKPAGLKLKQDRPVHARL